MPRAYSPEQLAAVLTAGGMPVTGRTVRNWCDAGTLPARKNRLGHYRISAAEVARRWPSLFLPSLRLLTGPAPAVAAAEGVAA
jgi:hypothetical protein